MSNIAKLANLLQSINAKTGTGLNLSIDFVGGNEIQVVVSRPSTAGPGFDMVEVESLDATVDTLEQGLGYMVEELTATFRLMGRV